MKAFAFSNEVDGHCQNLALIAYDHQSIDSSISFYDLANLMSARALLLSAVILNLGCPPVCRAQGPTATEQALPLFTVPEPVRDVQTTLESAIRAVDPALAAIAVFPTAAEFPLREGADPFEAMFSGRSPAPVPARFGMGVAISQDQMTGIVSLLTCAHLLEPVIRQTPSSGTAHPGEAKIAVRFDSSQTFFARIRALDARSDLAVLQLDLSDARHPVAVKPVMISSSASIQKGALVLACGDPWELARSSSANVSFGMVSNMGFATARADQKGGRESMLNAVQPWMQIDIRQGANFSGGAVIDLEGHLLGLITTLHDRLTTYPAGIFALPCTRPIRKIIALLEQGYEVEYGDLLLDVKSVPSNSLRDHPGLESRHGAAEVTRVVANSPADRAGIRVHDLVLKMNGVDIDSAVDLLQRVTFLEPGTDVELVIVHPASRTTETVRMKLGKWTTSSSRDIVVTAWRQPAWRGLRLDFPAPRASLMGEGALTLPRGVLIRDVLPGSAAAAAGLKMGEFVAKVGEQPVETPGEFEEALKYWPGSVPLTLLDGREIIIEKMAPM